VNLAFVGFGSVPRRFLRLLQTRASTFATIVDFSWQVVGIATARHGMAVDPRGIDVGRAFEIGERHGNFGALDATSALDAIGAVDAMSDADAPQAVDSPDRPDRMEAPGTTDALARDDGSGSPRFAIAPATTRDFLNVVTRLSSDHLVVVENTPLGLDGGQPGVDHVRHALSAGASVITANKGPAAFAFSELDDLARRRGGIFLGEGAALDGLPVFSLIRNTLPGIQVRGFRGVVNTTTNYALSRMETGQHLDDAVREMKEAGITEADPSHDIDGWDAAAKTAVLANTLMKGEITPHDVARESLRALQVDDVQQAYQNGTRIKVIASAEWRNGRLVASARPTTLQLSDRLATLDGTAKGLELETDLLGRVLLSKEASGVEHTAYALFCDFLEIARRRNSL